LGSITAPGPVHHLVWSADILLAGSIDGTVNVFNVDQTRLYEDEQAINNAVSFVGQAIQRPSKVIR
jgi:hypothetical protein